MTVVVDGERTPRGQGSCPIPTRRDERLHTLDILRGVALFGMILVHFHQRMRLDVSGLEDLIGWGVYIFVEQKAWGTFAFLFGAGFAILLRSLDARRAPVAAIYLRRLAALAALGIVTEVGFGFHILFTYACWGVPLLLMRRWTTTALLVTALIAVIARPVAAEIAMHVAMSPTRSSAIDVERVAAYRAAANGSYRELLAARWALFVATTPGSLRALLPDMNFALFVIGLLAVRHRVIDEPGAHRRLIAGWMLFGAASWAVYWLGFPFALGGLVQDQWLCLTYVGGALLLLTTYPAWIASLAPFARAGRMALTNYLLQALVLDFLASGYGLGLKLRPLMYAPAAAGLFALEAMVSTLWLNRYRVGPLEWLWRSITYWRWQPIRNVRDQDTR